MQGNFTSPGYPYNYPDDLDCTWIITVPNGYYVYVHFEHFHLEGSRNSCPYDYVQIYDENNPWNPIITKRCDYHDSWCVYSNSNVLCVRFITDGSVSYSGFHAHYERVLETGHSICSSISGQSTTRISPSSATSKIINFQCIGSNMSYVKKLLSCCHNV